MKHKLTALLAAFTMAVSVMPSIPAMPVTAAGADAFSYPVQEFRFGIGDTNRSITISGTNSGDYVSSAEFLGNRTQKWYLNYIASGVYEIVNSQTGHVLTNEGGLQTSAGISRRYRRTLRAMTSTTRSSAMPTARRRSPSIPKAIPFRWTATRALCTRPTS